MKLRTYLEQHADLPTKGSQIIAQHDEDSLIVYQAYRPSIGHYAAEHQTFGGEFNFNRMTWIKPNFLWMMFRSGWGTKVDQEVTLALRIKRVGFEKLLERAVPSSFFADKYDSHADWSAAVVHSDVRLQWDPDHNPSGGKLERRAIQLGLKGETLKEFVNDWIIEISDISEFVEQQRGNIKTLTQLIVPQETIYPVTNQEVADRIGITAGP